jgi:hypothetical protein
MAGFERKQVADINRNHWSTSAEYAPERPAENNPGVGSHHLPYAGLTA